ncbi:leucine-rich repeat protein [Paenibacillus azoreducens]|uniref:leucine-rich repeat protein n=1 Tax=Paenibacillus azoreducens TaxID=116718 RepID=UPI0039F5CE5E
MVKRVLSLLLTIILVISAFPLGVLAEEMQQEEPITPIVQNSADKGIIIVKHLVQGSDYPLRHEQITRSLGTHTVYANDIPDWVLAEPDRAKEVTLSYKDEIVTVVFYYKKDIYGGDFEFDESTGTIINYRDNMGTKPDVVIPETIRGVPVKKIGGEAFRGKNLTSVVIPNGVIEIGESAFFGNKLVSVTIPDTVVSIGNQAFMANQLTSITIPNSVTTIGDKAFQGNELENVIINHATNIGKWAFYKNKLEDITIPDGITIIGEGAFNQNQLKNVNLPNSLITIEKQAFMSNQLKDITIPDSVTSIGEWAFYGNQLESATLSKQLTTMGNNAFSTNKLKNVTIPEGVTSIGVYAFLNNQLTSIDIPESVTEISKGAFANNQIKNITVRSSIPNFDTSAFSGNPVQHISLPGDIDNPNFSDGIINLLPSEIIIVTDENSPVHTMAVNKGRAVQLTGKTVTFDLNGGEGDFPSHTIRLGEPLIKPEAIPTKKNAVFKNWQVSGGSVYDFRNVTENITIFAKWEETIPDTATIIVNHIDMDTNNVLETETLTEELGTYTVNAKEIAGYTLVGDASKEVTLTTKDEEVTVEFKYKKDQFEFEQSTGTITKYIGTEQNVVIPETIKGVSVVNIGDHAFKEKQLQSVVIPNSVTSIGNEAFYDNQLKEVNIPNSVISIGEKAFMYNHLENINIPDSVTSIGNYAFMANVLTDITIPTSLTKLNVGVFARNQLKNVIIPSNVTSIEDIAFFMNPLEFISIPSSTTYIHKSYDTIPNPAIIIAEENSPAHTWATEVGKPIQLVGKTATFNLNGGQGNFPSHTVGFGNPLIKPEATPTKENAYFWYWRINLDSDSNYDFRSVTEDITIYAEWEEILPDTATIYVSHKAVDTNEELEVETLTKELGTHTVHSKEFAGYILADDASKDVTLSTKDEEVLVEFKYKKDPFEFDESTGTITGYTGTELNVVIPETIRGVSVVNIGDHAFKGKQLQTVVLPDSVTSIREHAFSQNQLKNIIIPDGVTDIGIYAFSQNELTAVSIPNGITSVASGSFSQNQLKNVVIPDSVTSIGEYAFSQNQLKNIVIPDSVTSIGIYAFYDNQLTDINIPYGMTKISNGTFKKNQLTNVIVPNNIIKINNDAFYENPLEYISISSSTTDIYYKENAYPDVIPSSTIIIAEENSGAHTWGTNKGMAIQLVGKTATYNLNGGEGSFPSHTVKLGEPLVKPEAIPTKKNAVFMNWLGRVCKPYANQIMEEASFKKSTKVTANLS